MKNNKKLYLSIKNHLIVALVCLFSIMFFVACSPSKLPNEPTPSEQYQSVCTAEMLNASVAYEGNLARLQSALKKAKNGEGLTVAFLGGSITVGAGAVLNKSYVELTKKWLNDQFPTSKINVINAGISGTGSLVGIHRLKNEVLDYNPDIVVVEFAVNDGVGDNDNLLNPYDGVAFESIVVDILKSNSQTAVVILNECIINGYGSRKDKTETAKFYQVPVIDYFYAMNILIGSGEKTWADFTKDSIHPTTLGHKVTHEILINIFTKALTAETQPANSLPLQTRTGAYFSGGKMLDKNAEVVNLGAFKKGTAHWYFKNGFTGAVGQPLVIKITAKNIGIFLNKTTKNDGVNFMVKVNGKEKTLSTVSDKAYEQLAVELICIGEEKEYTIEISVSEIAGSSNANNEFFAFMVS